MRGKDAFVSLTPLDTQENFNGGRTHYISDIFYLFLFCFSFAFCCFMFSCQEGEDASDEENRVQDVQEEHENDAKQAR